MCPHPLSRDARLTPAKDRRHTWLRQSRRWCMKRWYLLAFATLSSFSALFPATRLAAADGDFRPKTMNLIIVFEAGGTYDLYGRIAAAHLPRFLPGNPAM